MVEELDSIMSLMVDPEEPPVSDLDADVSKALEELAAQFEE
jgi:hypothetical protein